MRFVPAAWVLLGLLTITATAAANPILVGVDDGTATVTYTFNAQTNTFTFTVENTSPSPLNITSIGHDLPTTGTPPTGIDGFVGSALQPDGTVFEFTDGAAGSVPGFDTAVLDFAFLTGATFANGVYSEGLPPGVAPGNQATFAVSGAGFAGLTEDQIGLSIFLRFQGASVPEPMTLVLLGLGIGSAAWTARRYRA